MQEPLRVVFVEHRGAAHGTTAQLLADYDLDFRWQGAASPRELSKITEDFKPHIVLCTDDESVHSNHGLLGALRLLCSQTPIILVSSVCDSTQADARRTAAPHLDAKRPTLDQQLSRIPQDAADLQRGFAAVLDSSAEPAVISDAEGWITHANTRACQLLESGERSLVTVLRATHDQSPRIPHWLPVSDDAGVHATDGIAAAMPSRYCHHRLAYFDSWSLLPILVHVDDLIGCVAVQEPDYRAALAVIAVDRDGARIPEDIVNPVPSDELAPDAGPGPEPARYGSIVRISPDDYLVVLAEPSRPVDAATTVQRLLDSIDGSRSPLTNTGASASPQALAIDAGETPPRLAQARMSHDPQRTAHLRLGAELDDAIQRHALSVHYQPQFDVKTGRGCGVEALARWDRCGGESIAPSVFIPVAEQSGLIHALGAWMLKSACETAYAWCSRDAQRTTLSVNVSAMQIDENFGAVVGRALERSGFPAKQLELEITESALIANPDLTIEYMKQWKQLGVRIAMDDFGTGYSSLSYLSRLPVDRLKLDQSLIHRMPLDPKAAAVTRLIVSLGAELGIEVIAEGVETEQQLQMLTDLRCPRVQGYLFGRPMPAKQAQLALRKTWGNRLPPQRRSASTVLEAAYA